jgi:hypothetical protein
MAVSAAPFALKNLAAGLDAEQLRQAVASTNANAGGLVQAGDLPVTQTATPSMGVLVGVGRAWMPGTDVANLSGQSYSTQGQYFGLNAAAVTVTISTANATNPRIDLVYIGGLDSAYSGSSDLIKIDRVTGTAASSPAVPALPKNAIALAQVYVAANATSILNANITTVAKQMPKAISVIPSAANQALAAGGVQPSVNDFANGVKTPITQAGTVVLTTDSSGYFAYTYPVPFPGGVLCFMPGNGDSAQGRDLIISSAGTPFTQTAATGYGSAVDHTGAAAASRTIRVNYVAYGW